MYLIMSMKEAHRGMTRERELLECVPEELRATSSSSDTKELWLALSFRLRMNLSDNWDRRCDMEGEMSLSSEMEGELILSEDSLLSTAESFSISRPISSTEVSMLKQKRFMSDSPGTDRPRLMSTRRESWARGEVSENAVFLITAPKSSPGFRAMK